MKKQHVILAVNMGVLLLGLVLVRYLPSSREKRFILLTNSILLISGQFFANLFLAAVAGQNRKAFLLSALMVLLIGFSTCILSVSLS